MWATRSVVQAPVGSGFMLSIGRGIIHRPLVFYYRIQLLELQGTTGVNENFNLFNTLGIFREINMRKEGNDYARSWE
jgi:hypothetical protein